METIEVGYRNIGSIGGVEYYHKFLIYTDSNGNQSTISGWVGNDVTSASPYGHMNVEIDLPYNQANPDHPDYSEQNQQQKQYREPVTEGNDLSDVWNGMLENALSKDDLYPYDPLRQNSNSLADTLLKGAGLNAPEDDNLFNPFDHWTPGADKELDENLVPLDPQSVPLEALDEKLKDWLDGDISDNIITLDTITVYANYEPSWGENTLNWISATWNSAVSWSSETWEGMVNWFNDGFQSISDWFGEFTSSSNNEPNTYVLYYDAESDTDSGVWEDVISDNTLYEWIEEQSETGVNGEFSIVDEQTLNEILELIQTEPTDAFTLKQNGEIMDDSMLEGLMMGSTNDYCCMETSESIMQYFAALEYNEHIYAQHQETLDKRITYLESLMENKIVLPDELFEGIENTNGTLSVEMFIANTTGTAMDSNDYIAYNTTNGNLYYDSDGNGVGTAIVFAYLADKPQDLSYVNFSVI